MVIWTIGSGFRSHSEFCHTHRKMIQEDKYQYVFSILSQDTSHMDAQSTLSAIDQLLTLNGWVAALCPTLTRPFGQNKYEGAYEDLASQDRLYYIGMVIHSADHFLVDQLAVIVQLAKRLGTSNLFVSMLDYNSSDSTETLTDLCEAVLTLLGVPFRIRRVPGMTENPSSAYYPLEEAHARNLALEPLHELYEKRKIKFHRVIWLKGFTCPNDILETIKISMANEAAMVCGMDWAEHNGFFIFSDRSVKFLHLRSTLLIARRWRTRDINGDQFRQSKSSSLSTSPLTSVPPRDPVAAKRYSQHLPFQAFCCESGTHVVDPAQSYYAGIAYRAGTDFHNASLPHDLAIRPPDAKCLDSTQAWFCRDLWVLKAKEGMKEDLDLDVSESPLPPRKRAPAPQQEEPVADEDVKPRKAQKDDADANAGSDYDASDLPLADPPPAVEEQRLTIPNSVFSPARILVNPRCVTTYAGVSHTQLALDLFGAPDRDMDEEDKGQDVLDDWEGAPATFVCQEQQYVFHPQSSFVVIDPWFSEQLVAGGQLKTKEGLASRYTKSWRSPCGDTISYAFYRTSCYNLFPFNHISHHPVVCFSCPQNDPAVQYCKGPYV